MVKRPTLRLAFLVLFLLALKGVAQDPRYLVTHRWRGTGSQQTKLILINGERWRVHVRNHGAGDTVRVTVLAETGEVVGRPFLVAETMSTVRSFTGRGMHYVRIEGQDSSWSLDVEQYLTVIEEWHLLQALKQPNPRMRKLGEWFGGDRDGTYELRVPAGSWRLVYRNEGPGGLRATVMDERRSLVCDAGTSRPGRTEECWVHRNGDFLLRIRAADTNWKLAVYGMVNEETAP